MGPKCSSEEMLGRLIDGGMNIARFNFSHGTHELHQPVLDRLRAVAAKKGVRVAALLDTKGPEIRTAMLKDHKPIELVKDQRIIVVACGDSYTTFEGYKVRPHEREGGEPGATKATASSRPHPKALASPPLSLCEGEVC